jgi:hypothetical protein
LRASRWERARFKPTRFPPAGPSKLGPGWAATTKARDSRQAALHLIFAGFDADLTTTRAWQDNIASLRVTRSLPYTETGTSPKQRRGRIDAMVEFSMTAEQWATARRDDIHLVGVEAVREQLTLARL